MNVQMEAQPASSAAWEGSPRTSLGQVGICTCAAAGYLPVLSCKKPQGQRVLKSGHPGRPCCGETVHSSPLKHKISPVIPIVER